MASWTRSGGSLLQQQPPRTSSSSSRTRTSSSSSGSSEPRRINTGTSFTPYVSETGGGIVQSGPSSVAVEYDRSTGTFVYVEAESVDGQQLLAGQLSGGTAYGPGVSPTLALDDMNVDYVLAQGHTGNLNQQDVRASQEILPGTSMETNFGTGSRGIKEAAPPPPDAPVEYTSAAPAARPPGKSSPGFRRRRNSGGLRIGGSDATSVADFSLGGLADTNPLSIRSQR